MRADAGVIATLEDKLDPARVGAVVVPKSAGAEDDGALRLDIGFAMRKREAARR
jgi:hypothetical protein